MQVCAWGRRNCTRSGFSSWLMILHVLTCKFISLAAHKFLTQTTKEFFVPVINVEFCTKLFLCQFWVTVYFGLRNSISGDRRSLCNICLTFVRIRSARFQRCTYICVLYYLFKRMSVWPSHETIWPLPYVQITTLSKPLDMLGREQELSMLPVHFFSCGCL